MQYVTKLGLHEYPGVILRGSTLLCVITSNNVVLVKHLKKVLNKKKNSIKIKSSLYKRTPVV